MHSTLAKSKLDKRKGLSSVSNVYVINICVSAPYESCGNSFVSKLVQATVRASITTFQNLNVYLHAH